jgi:hypothetical protein
MSTRQLLRSSLAILLIIAAAAAWLARDQLQINWNLGRLRKLVAKSEDEKTIAGMIRARQIAGYFSMPMDVALGAPWPAFTDRDELATSVHYARSMAQTIKVTIRNKTLDVSADRKSATMVLAAEAVVTVGGQTDRDIRELRMTWEKQQGKWLISRVDLKETIRRPQGLEASYLQ